MSKEMSLNPVSVDDSLKLQKVASGLHQSGLYPHLKGPAAAYAVTQYGMELGLGPMTSLQNINLIQGKPAANGQTMLSLAMSRGVTFHVQEETSERCVIKFKRGEMEYTSTFTYEDAQRAGLTSKDNWKKWPTEMLYWRAVAKGVRRIAPEAVMGLYTPEELTHGERTEVTVESQPRQQQAQPEPEPEIQDAEFEQTEYITQPQLKKLATVLTNLGVTDRSEKLGMVNNWLANQGMNEIQTSKELTKDQATALIDDLQSELEGANAAD